MKLLICTQKVDKNDDVLGFMHSWIEEFSRQCDEVTVIALGVGAHDLPPNVRVFSLGKERAFSTPYSLLPTPSLHRLAYIFRFLALIWRERKNYDTVLVHMNPEYVILGGIPWKAMGKRVALWYAHGAVPRSLRLAEHGADVIFTSTESGFRLPSKKVRVVGQGIDTAFFVPPSEKKDDGVFRIVTIGRISPVKDIETIVTAVGLLDVEPRMVEILIVGGAGIEEQEPYVRELERKTKNMRYGDRIFFVGAVPNHATLPYLQGADLFVNASRTGSLDKAVLEAMAVGLPVVTCNEALDDILKVYRDRLMFPKGDATMLAERIKAIMKMSRAECEQLGKELRAIVVRDHALSGFVGRILEGLEMPSK